MKPVNLLKAPFGNGTFSRVRSVSYLQWQDAFDVTFDDGIHHSEGQQDRPQATVRSVERDEELRSGFFVHYDNGQTAEVSWAFIRELPPKAAKK
jgi:hypothetical protein